MRKALFLDRDGVINRDFGYVYKSEQIVFIEGIFELCQLAQQKDYLLIIVTNQSGIARGYYKEHDFQKLMSWMSDIFRHRGCPIDAVYHCPFMHEHEMRKPNPGMILQAASDFNLNLNASVMVGDKLSDMQAAQRASVGKPILFTPVGVNVPEAYSGPRVSSLHEVVRLFDTGFSNRSI